MLSVSSPSSCKSHDEGATGFGLLHRGWGDQTDLNLYIFSRMERVRLCNRVEFDFLAIKIKMNAINTSDNQRINFSVLENS